MTGDACGAGVWLGPRAARDVQAVGRWQRHVRAAAWQPVRNVLCVPHGEKKRPNIH